MRRNHTAATRIALAMVCVGGLTAEDVVVPVYVVPNSLTLTPAERTGLEAAAVDQCMTLGVAHPMGPLALLDLVGLDVAVAIGQAVNAESGNPDHLAPATIGELIGAGHLGRKTGRGFYDYS